MSKKFLTLYRKLSEKTPTVAILHDNVLEIGNFQFFIIDHAKRSDEIFIFADHEDHIFVMYSFCPGMYQLVNTSEQFISGILKCTEDHFETPGCFVDYENKTMCYRICKNCSTVISKIYQGAAFGYGNWSKYIHLDEAVKLQNFFTYFVYRDPIDRFLSTVSHFQRKQAHSVMLPKFIQQSLKSNNQYALYISHIYEVIDAFSNTYPSIDEEAHITPQYMLIDKAITSGIHFNTVVEKEKLKEFIQTELNTTYKFDSICGVRPTNISVSTNILDATKSALKNDYELRNKFESIMWRANK